MSNEKDYSFAGVTSAQAREESAREQALKEAIKLTCGDRNIAYGPPAENLTRVANLFKAYMGDRLVCSITAADIAAYNVLLKLSRVATNPTHRDSWVDAAAYAAIGLECAQTTFNSQKQKG